MILDKILAQGVHFEGNENDSSYECYSFDFKPTSGDIVINLQIAKEEKFPGNSEAEKSQNQEKKRQAMLSKLLSDLSELIGPGFDDIKYIEGDKNARKLTLKGESFQLIGKYINAHPAESVLLRIGMNIINIFSVLYYSDRHRPSVLKSVLERNIGGVIVYRKDNFPEASRFPHQFYIGKVIPDSPDASVKANIEQLGQQLRDAFKVGIAKILNKDPNHVFIDTHYDEQNALSFNMSDEDFNTLKARVGANNVAAATVHRDVTEGKEAINHQDDRRDEEGMHRNNNEVVSETNVAAEEIGQLNADVFDHYLFKLPLHSEKDGLIRKVQDKFIAVQDIAKLSAMYKYINSEAKKRVLNIHEHSIYDSVFFKSNTNSWQKMIEQIRNHALRVLFNDLNLNLEAVLGQIKEKSFILTGEDANRLKSVLEPHLTDPLFCEHRSNNFFRNLFHSTSAVKKMQTIIDYCDAKINSENAVKAPRLSKLEEA